MSNYPDMSELFAAMKARKERLTEHDKAVGAEIVRQLIHGPPPSQGLPDVRPHHPRYEPPINEEEQ